MQLLLCICPLLGLYGVVSATQAFCCWYHVSCEFSTLLYPPTCSRMGNLLVALSTVIRRILWIVKESTYSGE